jgi:hypothetical protein
MKRIDIIKSLISEGFSEKTLARMTDKQLNMLSERIITTTKALKANPDLRAMAISQDPNQPPIEVKEKELSEKKDKKWIQKAIHPSKKGLLKKALGVKKGQTIPSSKLAAAAKKSGKLGQRARLAKTLKNLNENDEKKSIKEDFKKWAESLVENKYHQATTKNEIMNLIKSKLQEQAMPTIAPPKRKVEPEPWSPEKESPDENPYIDPTRDPGIQQDPDPKFQKISFEDSVFSEFPDFLTFDKIENSVLAEEKKNKMTNLIIKKIKEEKNVRK